MAPSSPMMLQGYLSALTAAVLFGIQYVPVKKHEIYDGTVFQWFMCSGILFTGVVLGICSAGEVPQVALVDLVGGMFWTAQNMLLMPVVKLLGLGLGFAIYSATNVLAGYAVGRFGLFGSVADPGRLPWLRDSGAACLVASFAVMVLIRPQGSDDDGNQAAAGSHEAERAKAGPQARSAMGVLSGGGLRARVRSCPELAGLEQDLDVDLKSQFHQPSGGFNQEKQQRQGSESLNDPLLRFERKDSMSSDGSGFSILSERFHVLFRGQGLRVLGVGLVVFAGFLNALSALPFNWWLTRNPTLRRGSFVFAQALGTWMVSTALYLAYASGRRVFRYASPRHSCIRPAFLSGFFWALGFVFMCSGIDGLGFTAGYTYAAVLPVVVSSLISVLWFREIRGKKQILLFLLCFFIQSVGVTCIAFGSH
eukprot:CAMPEP_0179088698 /NCGR_PEP_ID=MMETSP0796-20121207/40373_1 /TAXON_ID=73915 /ORGANISM="Pyrodinium bahamense, Strain pbaha01" /LENGTH=421 /DNA_ID=CAMNT_0020786235 /DNA_START=55 /DNA_END=1320 /DNA_ORIENTATION=+